MIEIGTQPTDWNVPVNLDGLTKRLYDGVTSLAPSLTPPPPPPATYKNPWLGPLEGETTDDGWHGRVKSMRLYCYELAKSVVNEMLDPAAGKGFIETTSATPTGSTQTIRKFSDGTMIIDGVLTSTDATSGTRAISFGVEFVGDSPIVKLGGLTLGDYNGASSYTGWVMSPISTSSFTYKWEGANAGWNSTGRHSVSFQAIGRWKA